MKIMRGKWFLGVRLSNDLFVGIGKPSPDLLAGADWDQPHSKGLRRHAR